jgi:hypothetical protein
LYSGIGVQSAKYTLYTAHLILPFKKVKERMSIRKMLRRGRRSRRISSKLEFSKRPHRQMRVNNRRKKFIPPSIKASRLLEIRIIFELYKIYPISEIRYEFLRAPAIKGFSEILSGQKWLLEKLNRICPVVCISGYQTSNIRDYLKLKKNKIDKSTLEFNTHAVDGVAIASSHFVEYKKSHRVNLDSAKWVGSVSITNTPLFIVKRPSYNRRQLHLQVPAKNGIRRKYGGTTTKFLFRKGDLVQSPQFTGFVSGQSKNLISISDCNWKRLVQITHKKVNLLRRSNGLIVSQ